MPKPKAGDKKVEHEPLHKPIEEADKIIDLDEEEELGDELVPGTLEEDELEDDEAVLDEEEVNPFGDKWEE